MTALMVLVLVTGSDLPSEESPQMVAASAWSKPVESHDQFLRARWLLLEGRSRAYAGPGQELMLYVEIENATSAWGEPLRVYFDPSSGLHFDVVDKNGKQVPPSPTVGSGGDVGACWITIPYDSSVRLRANPSGWTRPPETVLALPLRPMQGRFWVFGALPEGGLAVTAKLTVSPPTEDNFEHRYDWRGTIEFPPAKLRLE